MNVGGVESRFRNFKDILISLVGAFFMVYILLWNFQTIDLYDFPDNVEFVAYLTRIDQKWNMFSPKPMTDDGWYVIPGTLVSEEEVDLFNNGEVSFDKPDLVSATYKNQRWRKYMMNLWDKDYSYYRTYYADYLCMEWNTKHEGEEKLKKLEIVYMREDTLLDYKVRGPEKVVLLEFECLNWS